MNLWYLITLLGEPQIWMILSILFLSGYFTFGKKIKNREKRGIVKKLVILLFISIYLTLLIVFLLKFLIPIERPCVSCSAQTENCNPYCENDHTFPSGHAALSFTVFTSVFLVLRRREFMFLFIIPILISYSRYILNVHYPIDIFVGALIGIAVAFLTNMFLKKKLKY